VDAYPQAGQQDGEEEAGDGGAEGRQVSERQEGCGGSEEEEGFHPVTEARHHGEAEEGSQPPARDDCGMS
jgi:hypothetical protein